MATDCMNIYTHTTQKKLQITRLVHSTMLTQINYNTHESGVLSSIFNDIVVYREVSISLLTRHF